ncbi:hypothetical protein BD413DRAFT_191397 [Trametes elegans]|nr:hypothetical protein BD413DRAFT_191397 [Trametes elegans]
MNQPLRPFPFPLRPHRALLPDPSYLTDPRKVRDSVGLHDARDSGRLTRNWRPALGRGVGDRREGPFSNVARGVSAALSGRMRLADPGVRSSSSSSSSSLDRFRCLGGDDAGDSRCVGDTDEVCGVGEGGTPSKEPSRRARFGGVPLSVCVRNKTDRGSDGSTSSLSNSVDGRFRAVAFTCGVAGVSEAGVSDSGTDSDADNDREVASSPSPRSDSPSSSADSSSLSSRSSKSSSSSAGTSSDSFGACWSVIWMGFACGGSCATALGWSCWTCACDATVVPGGMLALSTARSQIEHWHW